ncbi:MAG: right-handed parallel beta-helix repeat-containing protein [Candidatus Thermoplasmatota archaeon]
MKPICIILLLSFIAIFIALNAKGYTTPDTNVSWDMEQLATNSSGAIAFIGSTYYVHEDITISKNDTLFVNNSELRFDAKKGIFVYGKLFANNSTFTSNSTNQTPDDWYGIKIIGSGTLDGNIIEYGKYGIYCEFSSPYIANNTIRYNSIAGIFAINSSSIIQNNSITKNGEYILLSEVAYDVSVEPHGEWIELFNPTSFIINISDYKIQDNSDVYTIPKGTFISPLNTIILARNQTNFNETYGFLAELKQNLSLSNTGDFLKIINRNGYLVDEVYWESESNSNLYANKGNTIKRKFANYDRNLEDDWQNNSAPDPKIVNLASKTIIDTKIINGIYAINSTQKIIGNNFTELANSIFLLSSKTEITNNLFSKNWNYFVYCSEAHIIYDINAKLEDSKIFAFEFEVRDGGKVEFFDIALETKNFSVFVNGEFTAYNASLLLENMTIEGYTYINASLIEINSSYNCEHHIEVKVNASILIMNSKITAKIEDNEHNYGFFVFGKIKLINSELSYCGMDKYSANGMHYGLWLNGNGVNITDSTIKKNYYGIVIYLSSPIFSNTRIIENFNGIYVLNSKTTIEELKISSNSNAGIISENSYGKLARNRIENNKIGIELRRGNFSICDNIIASNEIGIFQNLSSDEIIYNDLENNNVGIRIDRSNSKIFFNYFFENFFGVESYNSVLVIEENIVSAHYIGLEAYNSSVFIGKNTISLNNYGIHTSNSNLTADSNRIESNNFGFSISIDKSTTSFINNNIILSNGYGIYILSYSDAFLDISKNVIIMNKIGIKIFSYAKFYSNFEKNNLYGNNEEIYANSIIANFSENYFAGNLSIYNSNITFISNSIGKMHIFTSNLFMSKNKIDNEFKIEKSFLEMENNLINCKIIAISSNVYLKNESIIWLKLISSYSISENSIVSKVELEKSSKLMIVDSEFYEEYKISDDSILMFGYYVDIIVSNIHGKGMANINIKIENGIYEYYNITDSNGEVKKLFCQIYSVSSNKKFFGCNLIAFNSSLAISKSIEPKKGMKERIIFNSAPSIKYLKILPEKAYANSTLSAQIFGWFDLDGDKENYIYKWQLWNGYDYITLSNKSKLSNAFVKGDMIRLIVIPFDGYSYGNEFYSIIKISNSLPTISSVELKQKEAYVNSTLSANIYGWFDLDGDKENYIYQWQKLVNGQFFDIKDCNEKELSGKFLKGDIIRLVVIPFDGESFGELFISSPITILNSKPTIDSAYISPIAPTTASKLYVEVIGLKDKDSNSVGYKVNWEVWNGISFEKTFKKNFRRGERIRAEIITYDDEDYGNIYYTNEVSIINTKPKLEKVWIEKDDFLYALTYGWKDEDGDNEKYFYQWEIWDGEKFVELPNANERKLKYNIGKIRVKVTPFDGYEAGEYLYSNEIILTEKKEEYTLNYWIIIIILFLFLLALCFFVAAFR